MRKLSPLAKFIQALLKKQKAPKTMKWILDKVLKSAPETDHRAVWNAVHNGCQSPAENPRIKKTTIGKRAFFEARKGRP